MRTRAWSVQTRLGEHVIVHALTAKEAKEQVQAILEDVGADDYVWRVQIIRDVNSDLSRRAEHGKRKR